MFLLPYFVGLADQALEFIIQLVKGPNPKVMNMISGRKRIDFMKTRIFDTAVKHQVAGEPLLLERYGGKNHPNLKSDSCPGRRHLHGAAPIHKVHESAVQPDDILALPLEMRLDRDHDARVRLIPICKQPPAATASPHGPFLLACLPRRHRDAKFTIQKGQHIWTRSSE